MKEIRYSRVVHLSHVLQPAMPHWPGDPATSFDVVARRDTDGFHLRRISLGEHSGTHVNAASAFYPDGRPISKMPADALVVPAVVIDGCAAAAADPDFLLTPTMLRAWEERHGRVTAGSLVILYTGWQRKWHDPVAFLGRAADGSLHFPGFCVESAEFLLDERYVAGIGIDTHGVDGGSGCGFEVNKLVLARDGLVVENLTNLDQMPPSGATVVLGALRLLAGSGSPAAVIGLAP